VYIPLLISKYLAKRRIAWVSLIAVMLCTALVLVVISVMSGWIDMFRGTFKGLSGDVVVRTQGLAGFPYYEEMIDELEAMPEVEAAVPTLEAFGLVSVNNQFQEAVRVIGLPAERIGLVNEWPESLYLQDPETSPDEPMAAWRTRVEELVDADIETGLLEPSEREAAIANLMDPVAAWVEEGAKVPSFDLPWPEQLYREAVSTRRGGRGPDAAMYPGVIVGTRVVGIARNGDRWRGLSPMNAPILIKFLLLAPDADGGSVDIERQKAEFSAWIVDNSRTGVFEADEGTIYADFHTLQEQLRLGEGVVYPDGIDETTGEPLGEPVATPARATKLQVAVDDEADLLAVRDAVEQTIYEVLARYEGGQREFAMMSIDTWDRQPSVARFLAAVERERVLIVTLFGFISIVAVFLILCIFYMIVKEKTRDIGILKSVGATSTGIASIFLGYGLVIGIVGGALGVLAGGLIVWNINEIHDLLGKYLAVEVWNAETYMFDKIPNTLRPIEAGSIFLAAVVSSVIGATVPALLAAWQRPVESLRFE
jgi:lipoprotein-releasing system permease protein